MDSFFEDSSEENKEGSPPLRSVAAESRDALLVSSAAAAEREAAAAYRRVTNTGEPLRPPLKNEVELVIPRFLSRFILGEQPYLTASATASAGRTASPPLLRGGGGGKQSRGGGGGRGARGAAAPVGGGLLLRQAADDSSEKEEEEEEETTTPLQQRQRHHFKNAAAEELSEEEEEQQQQSDADVCCEESVGEANVLTCYSVWKELPSLRFRLMVHPLSRQHQQLLPPPLSPVPPLQQQQQLAGGERERGGGYHDQQAQEKQAGMLLQQQHHHTHTQSSGSGLRWVGAFVEIGSKSDWPEEWIFPGAVRFHIYAVNLSSPAHSVYKEEGFQFSCDETDRGWHQLVSHQHLLAERFLHAENGSLLLRAAIFPYLNAVCSRIVRSPCPPSRPPPALPRSMHSKRRTRRSRAAAAADSQLLIRRRGAAASQSTTAAQQQSASGAAALSRRKTKRASADAKRAAAAEEEQQQRSAVAAAEEKKGLLRWQERQHLHIGGATADSVDSVVGEAEPFQSDSSTAGRNAGPAGGGGAGGGGNRLGVGVCAALGRAGRGYVGLKNHGATCYMNALLQSLYYIGKFRQAVYALTFQTRQTSGARSVEILEGRRKRKRKAAAAAAARLSGAAFASGGGTAAGKGEEQQQSSSGRDGSQHSRAQAATAAAASSAASAAVSVEPASSSSRGGGSGGGSLSSTRKHGSGAVVSRCSVPNAEVGRAAAVVTGVAQPQQQKQRNSHLRSVRVVEDVDEEMGEGCGSNSGCGAVKSDDGPLSPSCGSSSGSNRAAVGVEEEDLENEEEVDLLGEEFSSSSSEGGSLRTSEDTKQESQGKVKSGSRLKGGGRGGGAAGGAVLRGLEVEMDEDFEQAKKDLEEARKLQRQQQRTEGNSVDSGAVGAHADTGGVADRLRRQQQQQQQSSISSLDVLESGGGEQGLAPSPRQPRRTVSGSSRRNELQGGEDISDSSDNSLNSRNSESEADSSPYYGEREAAASFLLCCSGDDEDQLDLSNGDAEQHQQDAAAAATAAAAVFSSSEEENLSDWEEQDMRDLLWEEEQEARRPPSISLALQNLFFRLYTSHESVACKDLIRSFGWDAADAFTQQDTHELLKLLLDKVEEQMRGTRAEGSVKAMFEGEMETYIECIDVQYKSSRRETFEDLNLDVKGCAGVRDSLRRLVLPEVLEGENSYDAEALGKQRAKKGVRFLRFPPVCIFLLKRFDFDYTRMDTVKVFDSFAFQRELDLSEFCPDAGVYELHAVSVHQGDVNSGHYYCFIRPPPHTQWIRFDDDKVYPVSEYAAIGDNFGGDEEEAFNYLAGRPPRYRPKVYNAYILVYVKQSLASTLLADCSPLKVNPQVVSRCRTEELLFRLRNRIRRVLEQRVKVKVYHPLQFVNRRFLDLPITSFPPLFEIKSSRAAGILSIHGLITAQLHNRLYGFPPAAAAATGGGGTSQQQQTAESNKSSSNSGGGGGTATASTTATAAVTYARPPPVVFLLYVLDFSGDDPRFYRQEIASNQLLGDIFRERTNNGRATAAAAAAAAAASGGGGGGCCGGVSVGGGGPVVVAGVMAGGGSANCSSGGVGAPSPLLAGGCCSNNRPLNGGGGGGAACCGGAVGGPAATGTGGAAGGPLGACHHFLADNHHNNNCVVGGAACGAGGGSSVGGGGGGGSACCWSGAFLSRFDASLYVLAVPEKDTLIRTALEHDSFLRKNLLFFIKYFNIYSANAQLLLAAAAGAPTTTSSSSPPYSLVPSNNTNSNSNTSEKSTTSTGPTTPSATGTLDNTASDAAVAAALGLGGAFSASVAVRDDDEDGVVEAFRDRNLICLDVVHVPTSWKLQCLQPHVYRLLLHAVERGFIDSFPNIESMRQYVDSLGPLPPLFPAAPLEEAQRPLVVVGTGPSPTPTRAVGSASDAAAAVAVAAGSSSSTILPSTSQSSTQSAAVGSGNQYVVASLNGSATGAVAVATTDIYNGNSHFSSSSGKNGDDGGGNNKDSGGLLKSGTCCSLRGSSSRSTSSSPFFLKKTTAGGITAAEGGGAESHTQQQSSSLLLSVNSSQSCSAAVTVAAVRSGLPQQQQQQAGGVLCSSSSMLLHHHHYREHHHHHHHQHMIQAGGSGVGGGALSSSSHQQQQFLAPVGLPLDPALAMQVALEIEIQDVKNPLNLLLLPKKTPTQEKVYPGDILVFSAEAPESLQRLFAESKCWEKVSRAEWSNRFTEECIIRPPSADGHALLAFLTQQQAAAAAAHHRNSCTAVPLLSSAAAKAVTASPAFLHFVSTIITNTSNSNSNVVVGESRSGTQVLPQTAAAADSLQAFESTPTGHVMYSMPSSSSIQAGAVGSPVIGLHGPTAAASEELGNVSSKNSSVVKNSGSAAGKQQQLQTVTPPPGSYRGSSCCSEVSTADTAVTSGMGGGGVSGEKKGLEERMEESYGSGGVVAADTEQQHTVKMLSTGGSSSSSSTNTNTTTTTSSSPFFTLGGNLSAAGGALGVSRTAAAEKDGSSSTSSSVWELLPFVPLSRGGCIPPLPPEMPVVPSIDFFHYTLNRLNRLVFQFRLYDPLEVLSRPTNCCGMLLEDYAIKAPTAATYTASGGAAASGFSLSAENLSPLLLLHASSTCSAVAGGGASEVASTAAATKEGCCSSGGSATPSTYAVEVPPASPHPFSNNNSSTDLHRQRAAAVAATTTAGAQHQQVAELLSEGGVVAASSMANNNNGGGLLADRGSGATAVDAASSVSLANVSAAAMSGSSATASGVGADAAAAEEEDDFWLHIPRGRPVCAKVLEVDVRAACKQVLTCVAWYMGVDVSRLLLFPEPPLLSDASFEPVSIDALTYYPSAATAANATGCADHLDQYLRSSGMDGQLPGCLSTTGTATGAVGGAAAAAAAAAGARRLLVSEVYMRLEKKATSTTRLDRRGHMGGRPKTPLSLAGLGSSSSGSGLLLGGTAAAPPPHHQAGGMLSSNKGSNNNNGRAARIFHLALMPRHYALCSRIIDPEFLPAGQQVLQQKLQELLLTPGPAATHPAAASCSSQAGAGGGAGSTAAGGGSSSSISAERGGAPSRKVSGPSSPVPSQPLVFQYVVLVFNRRVESIGCVEGLVRSACPFSGRPHTVKDLILDVLARMPAHLKMQLWQERQQQQLKQQMQQQKDMAETTAATTAGGFNNETNMCVESCPDELSAGCPRTSVAPQQQVQRQQQHSLAGFADASASGGLLGASDAVFAASLRLAIGNVTAVQTLDKNQQLQSLPLYAPPGLLPIAASAGAAAGQPAGAVLPAGARRHEPALTAPQNIFAVPLRLELDWTPSEKEGLAEGTLKILQIAHQTPTEREYFGYPFEMVVDLNDTLSDIKRKVKEKLQLPKSLWSNITFFQYTDCSRAWKGANDKLDWQKYEKITLIAEHPAPYSKMRSQTAMRIA